MSATLRLPRFLADVVNTDSTHRVEGETLHAALLDLFDREPGLRNHLFDERGDIRPHVSIFVDRERADLAAPIPEGAKILVLQAVSGG